VQRLPEANPDIEQAKAAAEAAEETVVHHATERREWHQEVIVGPSGGPWQDDQQHTRHRADQYEEKHRNAMQP